LNGGIDDVSCLLKAIELAKRGRGHTRPNPAVGAAIVKGGKIIGEGCHKRAGGDHAEVAAIKNALSKLSKPAKPSKPLSGATIYVTLEPCSKPGRVGACTDAIVAAGLKRVVYGSVDPNPTNRGRAKRVLAKAGVTCEQIASKKMVRTSDYLIRDFKKHVTTGLPYVTVKIAMSLDGRICDDKGDAKWISSVAARRETGEMRERVDAIMVGAETVRKDNPSLLSHGKRNDDLIRVVVTRSGRLPKKAQVLTDGRNPTLVYQTKGPLREVMADLGARGIMHVLSEGGLELATALADEGLVDEWITVLAPCVIGHRPISSKILFRPSGKTETYENDVLIRCQNPSSASPRLCVVTGKRSCSRD